ncbi:MAG TPA: class I SAM-dependent methyltransferase [Candidatus Saccharimonadales bacterium]|nr:class I SAM-dependent methyltransferase [Candidatus Saccharimonadales bacterium]
MVKKFTSTPASVWDNVSDEYEDTSFLRKDGLYPANSFRYELILDFLKSQPKGKILDAGCGPGLMTRTLQKHGWEVTACDYSEGMIETSKKKAKEEGFPDVYQHLPLQRLSELNDTFDIVILNGVLPYISVEEEEQVFDEIKKVLKKGGALIASHYNLYFDIFALDKWGVKAIIEEILEPSGLEKEELTKAEDKINSLINNPDQVLDKEKTMKLEDPIGYKNKLKVFGFEEFDQAYYNLFYLPAKFEAEQNFKIREELERNLRRDPKGLLLYRTFVSFAKLSG